MNEKEGNKDMLSPPLFLKNKSFRSQDALQKHNHIFDTVTNAQDQSHWESIM